MNFLIDKFVVFAIRWTINAKLSRYTMSRIFDSNRLFDDDNELKKCFIFLSKFFLRCQCTIWNWIDKWFVKFVHIQFDAKWLNYVDQIHFEWVLRIDSIWFRNDHNTQRCLNRKINRSDVRDDFLNIHVFKWFDWITFLFF